MTEDDGFESPKKELCSLAGAEYVCLPKTLGYQRISTSEVRQRAKGSQIAREAALSLDFDRLCEAVRITSQVQLKEGMQELPDFGAKASKYCGSGHGGYAVYLFDQRPDRKELLAIEPFMKQFKG